MLARDIMTKEVITLSPSDSIKNAARILTKNQISGAPVVDKKGHILGIVSETDIVGKKGKQVKAIMSDKVISITENTPVEEVATLMTTHRLKRLPVLRGDKLIGIVSQADLVGAIAMGKHISLHAPVYDL